MENHHHHQQQQRIIPIRRLWIGGTSGLARTYCNAFQTTITERGGPSQIEPTHEPWLLLGHQAQAPRWLSQFEGLEYRQVDFTQPEQKETWRQFLREECTHVQQVVLSIRPPLVSIRSFARVNERHSLMLEGLQTFLQLLIQEATNQDGIDNFVKAIHIVHASSIAAIDHVQEQRLRSEASIPDPDSASLYHPYDRFKRRCEEILDDLVTQQQNNVKVTHVRLGAFFSDDPQCIQCSALALQTPLGCYLPTRIDCNSGKNVAMLLRAILDKPALPVLNIRYFYYTRPLSFASPVPYGEYLVAYRRAYDYRSLNFWLPVVLVYWIVASVHALADWWPALPWIQSVDYLLQVTKNEHTFDLSLVGTAYPEVVGREETLITCFRRRRYYLEQGY